VKNSYKEINLPDIKNVLPLLVKVKTSYDGKTCTIIEWIKEHRKNILKNSQLIKNKSDKNDIKILISILRDLLIRAMQGERGGKVFNELQKSIKTKQDLNHKNYVQILKRANYRWGPENGAKVLTAVVNIFKNEFKWNWKTYFKEAEKHSEINYPQDKLLKTKNVSFKVRDLALSNFNQNFVANDLHVVRVMTRIGLLCYGFDLLKENNVEMGNNPADEKNYLFLHKLILKLSKLMDSKYSPADLDRIFWYFGRAICGSETKCSICPINNMCLTGKYRKQTICNTI
jgi:endonuclease III